MSIRMKFASCISMIVIAIVISAAGCARSTNRIDQGPQSGTPARPLRDAGANPLPAPIAEPMPDPAMPRNPGTPAPKPTSAKPTAVPTAQPTAVPTAQPTSEPTAIPPAKPSWSPVPQPAPVTSPVPPKPVHSVQGSTPDERFQSLGLALELDPALSPTEQDRVKGDLVRLGTLHLAARASGPFEQMFGGPQVTDVLSYFDERVRFVLPNTPDTRDRRSVGRLTEGFEKIFTMASNLSTPLWMASLGERPRQLWFRIGDKKVPVDSPHVGIVMLGEGYGENFTQLQRIGTLVHEARHSDCTGGLTPRDLDNPDSSPNACGHRHIKCPRGHDFEGFFACDDHPWGAYAAEMVFASALARRCENCSETERQEMTAVVADSGSRILVLDEMLNGKFGKPDMTSSGLR